jgi:hypothetical protein
VCYKEVEKEKIQARFYAKEVLLLMDRGGVAVLRFVVSLKLQLKLHNMER